MRSRFSPRCSLARWPAVRCGWSVSRGEQAQRDPPRGQRGNRRPGRFGAVVKELAAAVARDTLQEIGGIDPDLRIEVRPIEGRDSSASESTTTRLVRLLQALPHGVLVMSRDLPGLVETSTNLAVASTADGRATIVTSSRSSVAPALRKVLDQVRAVGELSGASVSELHGYPGWQPNMASPLLTMCRSTWKHYGTEAKVTAVHAGLECGIINERLGGGLDMISSALAGRRTRSGRESELEDGPAFLCLPQRPAGAIEFLES